MATEKATYSRPVPTVTSLPQELDDLWRNRWQSLEQHYAQATLKLHTESDWCTVLVGSDYIFDTCCQQPELMKSLLMSGDLDADYDENSYAQRLTVESGVIGSVDSLKQILRQFRQREMVRIIWRDLTRRANTQETCRDLSLLADSCIQLATDWLYDFHTQTLGTPYWQPKRSRKQKEETNKSVERMPLLVIAVGKLGAYELNLSSDIDLIFAYPESGQTQGVSKPVSNEEFFTRLGRKLIEVLDQRTVDGFVFRVDMRLRPYGQSGALAMSYKALQQYYQEQGRTWERYAMIKARVVTGTKRAKRQLLAILRQFVYRRYVDFSVIAPLREMKALIVQEVRRRSMEENIKLGAGGIREIEFIAQAYQLIYGGRDREFQRRRLLLILTLLHNEKLLEEHAVNTLEHAYLFLRDTEHVLQAMKDEQTQILPTTAERQARVAWLMGASDWKNFMWQLDGHRQHVQAQFAQVFDETRSETEFKIDLVECSKQWLNTDNYDWQIFERVLLKHRALTVKSRQVDEVPNCIDLLDVESKKEDKQLIAQQIARVKHDLETLKNSRTLQRLQAISVQRLNDFMPMFLQEVWNADQPSAVIHETMPVIEAILRRSVYLVLLTENAQALQQLVRLCGSCPWAANQLAKMPILLDELVTPTTLYNPPSVHDLGDTLRQSLLRIPQDNLETQMDYLRYFVKGHMLRVAAAQVSGHLSLMDVSNYLTATASAVLHQILAIAWQQLTEKHGFPLSESGSVTEPKFIIVGYGKLGGAEMGYGSDLDLVFIHDVPANLSTDGDKPINNTVFFTRLGQRMIHILSTRMGSGQLYEVDLRLRPSGASGLIVTSLKAFQTYQEQTAWTWEHQALVRARVIVGDNETREKFALLRAEILRRKRELEALRESVLQMREKMRAHLGSKDTAQEPSLIKSSVFDLKQDAGGIVDIEFVVQYNVLAWAFKHPSLLQYTDNIRLLSELARLGIVSEEDVNVLKESYIFFRTIVHGLVLKQQPLKLDAAMIEHTGCNHLRRQVRQIWQQQLSL